jgi:hypothetical protein
MGDWTGTVPTFAAGAKVRGVDQQTMADIATAITAAWTTWTPTYANITSTSATIESKYRRVGKTVDFFWRFTLGASSAIGTSPAFTLPYAFSVAAYTSYVPWFAFAVDASSGTARTPLITFISGTQTLNFQYLSAIGTAATITATAPWTWTTSDVLTIGGTYYTD